MTDIVFPSKLQFLFKPSRYKVAYGGRDSGKSWGFARALLALGFAKPIRVLCAREFQKSIDDSVHKLLSDQIESMGLQHWYTIKNTEIVGKNGTEFTFHGLKHNIGNIKSIEGSDICWIEEAANVSRKSWDTLSPTIRKDGSEIWVTFNPELEEDETYRRFVTHPPTDSTVVKMTYKDNPWPSKALDSEREDARRRDPEAYSHIWEGNCKRTIEGAIYARELETADTEGRIMAVPYNPAKPVSTFWDLGWSDSVAIWFGQKIGFEYHLIDYLEDRQRTVQHYVQELQKRGYVYDIDWLPHDGKNATLASNGKSIEQMMRALGRNVRVQPNLSIAEGINAARTVFANCYFDRVKCADGLHCLRHYQYEVDPDTGMFGKNPLHNAASHGADAFRGFALSTMDRPVKRGRSREESRVSHSGGSGWMGN